MRGTSALVGAPTSLLPLLLVAGASALVFLDGSRRAMRAPGGWAFGVLMLALVFSPLYLARRPLLAGEARRGGKVFAFAKILAPV